MTPARHQVVAAILVRSSRILLCHRRDDAPWYPGVWDLPGGHVEPGETPDDAVVRECAEELGIRVTSLGERRFLRSHDADLTVFQIDGWDREPGNTQPGEHQAIRWCSLADLPTLPLADRRLETLARVVLTA